MVTSSILRAHISHVRTAAGEYKCGIYHEGGAPEVAWKIHAKMAAEPTKVFIACDIKNGFGAVRKSDAIEGARRWCPVLGTVFANLWAGKQGVQPTAWANTPGGDRPITVRDGLLQGACEALVAFALALRVATTEFEDEMRKQGVGLTTELEYWAYVDDLTIATTAEVAPKVMDRLKEILERHGLELRSDRRTAYCPTPGRVDGVREEMTRFVKWTPDGLMIMGTASDGDYRTEITAGARRNQEPTSERLQNARILAGKIRQMCEADLDCRRLAPAWKLVTIVLNSALSFDCCVVPPEALASYACFHQKNAITQKCWRVRRHISTPPITGGLPGAISGDCSQRGKCLRCTSDGNTGTCRSSQGCTGKIEAKGFIHRREGNAARGGFSKPRAKRRQCRKPGIEKETGELETSAGGGGDTERAPGRLCCTPFSAGRR